MKVAPFVISIIAIFLSCAAIYFSHLEPFSPSITAGDPMWSMETLKTEEKSLALIVPIIFSNHGAKPGCIVDMKLSLHSYDEARDVNFYPCLILDYSGFIKAKKVKESVFQHAESTFAPVLIPGKESIIRVLVFFSRHMLSPENLKKGKYRINYYYFERGKDMPEIFYSANYNIREETIDSLKKGVAHVPLNEERDKIRGK
jgi:hypothetical protein